MSDQPKNPKINDDIEDYDFGELTRKEQKALKEENKRLLEQRLKDLKRTKREEISAIVQESSRKKLKTSEREERKEVSKAK
jgi:hypothetical protein